MNRWQSQYQQFVGSESWKIICQFVDRPDYAHITENDRLSEALRFKKMVKLISATVKTMDIEAISQDYWHTILTEPDHILNYLSNIDDPDDPNNNYEQMNYRIDQIYTSIRLYVTYDEAAGQAASETFRTYQKDVHAAFESIAAKSNAAVENIESQVSSAQEYLSTIETAKHDIDLLRKEIFGEEGEEENGLKAKFTETYDELIKMQEAIQEFNYTLTEGDEEEGSIIQQISEAQSSILENKKKVNDWLESIQTPINRIYEFHAEIIGQPDIMEQGFKGGLKQDIEEREQALSDFENEQEGVYKKLVDRINELLFDATNASLAHAYSERKKDAELNVKKNTKYFLCSLASLFLMGLVIFVMSSKQTEWFTLPLNILKSSPVLVPIIWLATFFSKRRSEAHRLEQEYAHKEALARSYASFKEQIEELQKGDPKLLEILLDRTIAAIAFNPSVTLDKKHSSESPVREVADKILPEKET